ncbi:hypothetical protein FJU08_11635 [Martelella alba]|uniref:Uncharacterized protein n=1 Tax=Martelella alba TaxID=2590451 RepID=A0A506UBC9_9HYPH|nr:hypothetical protein FJU08_11635 [Martelella alba]
MIVLATTVQLELSIRIEAQGDLAKVESSAEVSRDAAMPCAVDRVSLTVAFEAVNTPHKSGSRAADKHLTRRAESRRRALDIDKNLLCWKLE